LTTADKVIATVVRLAFWPTPHNIFGLAI